MKKHLNRFQTTKDCNVKISEDGEKIWFSYPSMVENTDEYLKNQVLLEFGGRNVIDPNEIHTIQPYISEYLPQLQFPTGNITVLSPSRTFWEKATLIHVACSRGTITPSAHRIARHWYDLVKMSQHEIGIKALGNKGLFKDVVQHKKVFYHAGNANYDACLEHKIKLLPDENLLNNLETDYNEMINAGMIYNDPPLFSEIVGSISNLEDIINKK